jgi:hypothetical protein
MVDDVSSVSEETASEASTVSAATEEQTASINEVTQNVQTVSESAQSLRELVTQFDVGREGIESPEEAAGESPPEPASGAMAVGDDASPSGVSD